MKAMFNRFLLLFMAFTVQIGFAQQKTISGTVTDRDDMPVPGVAVQIQGSTTGTSTDFDGNYSINAEEGDVLEFSSVGFETQQRTVSGESTIDVVMQDDLQELDAVELVGYSNRKRENLTSAISSVSAEKIERFTPTTNVDQMLQGNAAGVQVAAANGKPGQNAFVRVRGQGTLQPGGGSPLYIVDGVPIEETDLNAVSGSDIQDIKVLKDAATTAQYGSRGANGVVMITTKKGKNDSEGVIKFSSRIGWTDKTPDNFKMMNSHQKLDYEREMGELGVEEALFGYAYQDNPEIMDELRGINTNWQDEVLRTGIVQSNNISMSGGSDKSNYYFSAGHERDQGVLDNVLGFERMNAKLGIESQVKDWLKLRANVNYSRSLTDNSRDRNNAQNPFQAMYNNNPYQDVYERDENGEVIYDEEGNPEYDWGFSGLNPIEYVKTNTEMDIVNTIIGNVGLDVDLLEDLTYSFNFGVVHKRLRSENVQVPGNRLDQLIGDPDFPGHKVDAGSNKLDYTITNLLNYNFSENDHNLGVTALQEFNFNEFNSYSISTSGYPNPNLITAISAGRVEDAYTKRNRLTLFSYGLLADYDYDSKYLFSASIRRDGSSNFGKDNQYGTFWSVSAGWNIANEDFFEFDPVDDLKLRASYGTTGNRNIGRYRYLGTIQNEGGYPGGSTAVPDNYGNPELQWEETTMMDIGIEFNMFGRRLRGVVDYYIKNTDNLLFNAPKAYESGIPGFNVASNLGEIENTGWELSLAGDIIRNNDWTWMVGGNITFYDNKIKSLTGIADSDGFEAPNTFMQWWGVGEKINQFYLLEYAGLDDENGRPLYYGGDGEKYYYSDLPTDQENRVKKGSVFPKFEGGINTTVAYRGLSLTADFAYKGGNHIYNQVYQNAMSDGADPSSNQAVDAANFWREPGDAAKGANPNPQYHSEANQDSDRFLEKGDYLRLRNLTIAYEFPKSVLDNLPINSLRIYGQGQNLLTFTKFHGDPEVGIASGETLEYSEIVAPGELTLYSYPNRKTLSVGLDVTF